MGSCKTCGGTLVLTDNPLVLECIYCGNLHPVSNLNKSKCENLYELANMQRHSLDFERALSTYEQILAENSHDARAYWCRMLCKFGVTFVEDPKTGKHMPTINRAQYESVLADENYKKALQYADEQQKQVYMQQAQELAEIQRNLLSIAENEASFDIFICYKETDEYGNRTPDSVVATEMYHELTRLGYRVFFSRITLETKLGIEYEPYIFAALNSAKIMIVVGTKPEYISAPWVKNEWERFLKLMRSNDGVKRMLIPAYRDMDPYNLPEEFAHLQAQNMGKLGFMHDLIYGINKILQPQEAQAVVQQVIQTSAVQTGINTDAVVERMFMFIEDGDYERANEYAERVLDANPKNAQAYLCKLLIEHNLSTADELATLSTPFNTGSNYKRLMMYADTQLKEKIEGYLKSIETTKLSAAYNSALLLLENAKTAEEYKEAAQAFAALDNFKDSEAKKQEAKAKQEQVALNAAYEQAQAILANAKTTEEYKEAAQAFAALGNYNDSAAKKEEAERKAKIVSSGNIIAIAAGRSHTVGLKADGTCVAVGKNSFGQCDVSSWKDIIAVSAGYIHTVGLKADGTCVTYEQWSEESSWKDIIAVSAGAYHTVGLKKDGTCVVTGLNEYGECDVSLWKDIIAVSAGAYHTVGLKADGTCVAVGSNGFGQCDVSAWKDIIAVSAGASHTVGLKKDGTCVAVGYKGWYDGLSDWKNIIAVSAGYYHTVGLKKDGTCVAVGDNEDGQCDVSSLGVNTQTANFNAEILKPKDKIAAPINNFGSDESELKKITAIAAGDYHTVGLKADGTCVAVGENDDGQCNVSAWKDIIAVSAGDYHTVGLKADGTCVAVGINRHGQCDVSAWKDIIAVSAGSMHTVGLKKDGTCVAVGWNGNDRCDVSAWKDIIAITAGYYHTVGLKADGTCVAVGENDKGQCDVSAWKDIIAVSAGRSHTVGLKKDGTCVAVGENLVGECNVSGWKDIIAISVWDSNTVGLKADGTCDAVGVYKDAAAWKDIIAIAVGSQHTVGLKKDGTCVAAGYNSSGQCDVSSWGK